MYHLLCIKNISHLFTHSSKIKQFYFKHFTWALVKVERFQVLLYITDYSIRYLYSNVKQFDFHYKFYLSGPEYTCDHWQWKGLSHSPKFQHYLTLAISLFSIISRVLFGIGCYQSAEMKSVYSAVPADWAVIPRKLSKAVGRILKF